MKTRSAAWFCVAVFALLLAVRLPVALSARSGGPLLMDELSRTLAAADRFLAAPLTNTHWPAMFNQLVLVPVIAVDFLIHAGAQATPEALVDYLSGAYRQPQHLMTIGRLATAVIASLGMAAFVLVTGRRTGSCWAPVIGVGLLASVPMIWSFTCENTAEGMAVGIACAAVGAAWMDTGWALRAALAGGAFGLALSARNTFAPFALIPLAMLWARTPGRRMHSVVVFGGAAALAMAAACPALWLEPVRFAKANLGNFRKTGTPVGWWTALCIAFTAAPVWFWITSVVAAVWAVRNHHRSLAFGALGVLLVLVAAASRSPFVQPRYFLSAVLATGVLSIVAASAAIPAWSRRVGPRLRVATVAVGLVLAGVATAHAFQVHWRMYDIFVANGDAMRARLQQSSGKHIALPFDYFHDTAGFATNESVRRMSERLEQALQEGQSVNAYLARYGLSTRVATAMPLNFNEKDVAMGARLRIMAAAPHPGAVDLEYIGDTGYAGRNGLLTREEAEKLLAQGLLDEVLVLAPEIPGATPLLGGEVVVLRRPPR